MRVSAPTAPTVAVPHHYRPLTARVGPLQTFTLPSLSPTCPCVHSHAAFTSWQAAFDNPDFPTLVIGPVHKFDFLQPSKEELEEGGRYTHFLAPKGSTLSRGTQWMEDGCPMVAERVQQIDAVLAEMKKTAAAARRASTTARNAKKSSMPQVRVLLMPIYSLGHPLPLRTPHPCAPPP